MKRDGSIRGSMISLNSSKPPLPETLSKKTSAKRDLLSNRDGQSSPQL